MYDPKFRFAILMSIFMVLAVGASLIKTYVFDGTTLDLPAYLAGIVRVGGATLGGFIFVWVCTKIITFDKYKKTGFEPSFRDETGTGFNFPVSLNKFLPDVIAAPAMPPTRPAHVFEGLMAGAILGPPIARPAKYANVSVKTVTPTISTMRKSAAPASTPPAKAK